MPASAPIALTTSIEAIPGVGATQAAALRRLGVPSAAHLIRHLPARHEFEAAESPIADLVLGQTGSARGEVTDTRVVSRGRKGRFEAVLMDESGRLDLVWFHQTYLYKRIQPGVQLLVKGKPRRYGPAVQMVNPSWKTIGDEGHAEGDVDRLRPIYPASEELPSAAIESIVQSVLDDVLSQIEDHLPEAFRRKRDLPELADAYRMMHRPQDEDEIASARRRLAFDELLLFQLGVHMKRAHKQRTLHAPALRWSEAIDEHIRARIPFGLTEGQNAAVRDIVADLGRTSPANRLIQGDVGSGKTVVALYAMLMAAASRRQAALMAPTELLAEQHFASISAMLEGSDVRLALLTGSLPEAERRETSRAVEAGEVDLVVGTHALLTESVRFASLGVAVIDEQHRFGVHQRARLREKADDDASCPHTLVMTATPIPRTLSLTIFGDLDVTTISDLPPGRRRVSTRRVGPERADEVYAHLRERLEDGEQAYIVVPAIESESGVRDVRSTLKRLEEGALAGLRLAAIHGRLKRATREQIMGRFRAGLIDALVATTVIEVGVDVPAASAIVIEEADRFGLAQLHQLRGRVGRGGAAADSARRPSRHRRPLCALIADPQTPDAKARLDALVSTASGFDLAEKDLEIRGPGEVIGSRQSGAAPFRVADLRRDVKLLLMARRDAAAWIEASPALDKPEEKLLRSRLFKTHRESLGLADVG